jgi:plasmid stability protein
MASITIRKLDPETKERLRVRAAQRRRSMEDEARHILREALAREDLGQTNLAESIRARFKQIGGVDLKVAPREPMREPPEPNK